MEVRRDPDIERPVTDRVEEDANPAIDEEETHATTGGSAVAGAVAGGLVGLAGGPVGAAIGAVGGAIVGVAAERIMHGKSREDAEQLPAGIHDDLDSSPARKDGDCDKAS